MAAFDPAMRKALLPLLLLLTVTAYAAQPRRRAVRPPEAAAPAVVVIADDFRDGARGWDTGFADYPATATDMELEAAIAPRPPELGAGTAMRVHSNNHSDDVFIFLKKKLTAADGIVPNQRYEISYRLGMASNVGAMCAGIGSPSESVYLKAGGWPEEPISLLIHGYWRMNVDIGAQSQGGAAASVAGNMANGSDDCGMDAPFRPFERLHRHTAIITSSPTGELWLLAGTDSGFEGIQTIYYTAITATLTPVP